MLGKTEGKRWLDSITDLMDVNLSKPQETVKDRRAWCTSLWCCKELDMTVIEQQQLSRYTEII